MSFEVSSTQRTPRRSFFQMAARRRNGDRVFITGDSRREVERARSLLMRAARRSGLRMLEIARMTELAAIIMSNPGVPDAVLGIAQAPHPRDTRQDADVLWETFLADIETTNAILDDDETAIDVIAWIANWQAGWCRFWALRHRDPAQRQAFRRTLAYNLRAQQPKIREIAKGRLDA
jgi:hypothetical protein